MEVRAAGLDDLEAAEAVRVATWRVAYRGVVSDDFLDAMEVTPDRVAKLRERHAAGAAQVLVAGDGEVVGMAVHGPSRDEDRPGADELYALYVLPSHWGTGVGQQLLEACGGVSSLWVLEGNPRARAFYERNGFRPDGAALPTQFEPSVVELRYVREPTS